MEDHNDEVSQWNLVNNDLDKVLRVVGSSHEATEADKARIAQEEEERFSAAQKQFEQQKSELERQFQIAHRNLNKLRTDNKEAGLKLKDSKTQARDEIKRRGQLKADTNQTHVDLLLEDKNLVIANKKHMDAERDYEEVQINADEVTQSLKMTIENNEAMTVAIGSLKETRAALQAEMDQLLVVDEEMNAREIAVKSEVNNQSDLKKRLADELNDQLRRVLLQIDQDTQKRLETRRAMHLATNKARLETEGPDVDSLRDVIKSKEDELALQQGELDSLETKCRELQGMLGQANALDEEIKKASESVREAKATSLSAQMERHKDVEKARIAYSREKAKNDTNTRTDILRMYRDKLGSAVGELIEALGCTEEELLGRIDEDKVASFKMVVDPSTKVIFDDVNPAQHSFRLLNLQSEAQSLKFWSLNMTGEGVSSEMIGLEAVVLPPMGSVLFVTGGAPSREQCVQ
eukprot:Ihof_evm10s47 gene=Ihof_evmTU10s47